MSYDILMTPDGKAISQNNPLPVVLASGGGTTGGNVTLVNSSGAEVGTAANPSNVTLRNSAGNEIGTSTNQIWIRSLFSGGHANAWNASAVAASGVSNAIDFQSQKTISCFGNASAATTITAQVSANGTNYYNTTFQQTLSGAGDFHFTFDTGARYVRLISSGAATITATISGKGS
ncbi:hypothetical protein [Paenibacillus pasadenensis]|uniref:hypothetical protein n=1 Tax=Paenibacillus pasadenensis TaxID=217090 RepID=UPI00203D73B3|nr:hypothetical protein [Paenibacillus pasadenensis]